MKKEEFKKEMENIQTDYINYQDLTEKRITNLLILAGKELGSYFVSKGFVHFNNYYYDPKTRVGIKVDIPDYIDLSRIYFNSVNISIVYKVGSRFLQHYKGICYYFKSESPEKVFNRFKKYNGKAESTRMKEYFKKTYPDLVKEMLKADRSQKIKTIKENE